MRKSISFGTTREGEIMKNSQPDLFLDYVALTRPQYIINQALEFLKKDLEAEQIYMSSPQTVKDFCRLKLAAKEHEVFGALFLDNQHRLIEFKELFRGTIASCSVHIREVVKEALNLNCAAMIFTHNHPSGICEPSLSDIDITTELKKALGIFDIRVLDHIVVSLEGTVSLAERGKL